MVAINTIAVIILFILFFRLKNKVEILTKQLEVPRREKIVNETQPAHGVGAAVGGADTLGTEPETRYKEAIAYVRRQMAVGVSERDLRAKLAQAGWSPADVSRIFVMIERGTFEPAQRAETSVWDHFVAWVRHDWMMKVGVLFAIMAAGWFVTYAFAHQWIGPIGRITLGAITGLAIVLYGERRISRSVVQGLSLVYLGTVTLMFTVYAAQFFYHMITDITALFLFILIIAYTGMLSVRHHSLSLALFVAVAAYLLPGLIMGERGTDFILILTGFISTALAVIVYFRRWMSLTFFILLGILFYSGDTLLSSSDVHGFGYVGYALWYMLVPFFCHVLVMVKRRVNWADILFVLGIGTLVSLWLPSLLDSYKHLLSLGTAFATLLIVLLSFIASTYLRRLAPIYLYGSLSTVFIVAAILTETHSNNIGVLLALLTVSLALLAAWYLGRSVRVIQYGIYFFIPLIILTTQFMSSVQWVRNFEWIDLLVLAASSVIYGGFALLLQRHVKHAQTENEAQHRHVMHYVRAYALISVLYVLVLIWLIPRPYLAWMTVGRSDGYALSWSEIATIGRNATAISLVIYALLGMVSFAIGNARNNRYLRKFGTILILALSAFLLLYYVWLFSITVRIIVFAVIGAILISGAIYLKNHSTATGAEHNEHTK